jgi:hypothetical protein
VTVQVFCYPEDAVLTGPGPLCELAAGLGADAIAVAVRYHPARRWFARHGLVRHSPPGITYLRPADKWYGRLRPVTVAGDEEIAAVHALREEATRHGLAFHAWMVMLHDDPVVAAYPGVAARTFDGTPTIHALCPSHPDVVEYAAALVADVCEQLRPDLVELESALYPAWDPSYVISLELAPLTGAARALAGQCFCTACVRLIEELGHDPAELERRAYALIARRDQQNFAGSSTWAGSTVSRSGGLRRMAMIRQSPMMFSTVAVASGASGRRAPLPRRTAAGRLDNGL